MLTFHRALAFVCLTVSINVKAGPTAPINFQSLIDDANKTAGFNGAMLVAQDGEVIFHNTIGFIDKNKSQKLGPNHLFSSGSIGKEFTTVALMMLAEQGKISYQDKVTQYLTWLPKALNDVTIEHLLTHTSGLPRVKWQKLTLTKHIVDQVNGLTELPFKPGDGYIYSNVNITLRALIVEQITKMGFEKFVAEKIFKPAGMSDSINIVATDQFVKGIVPGDYPTAVTGLTIYTTASDLYKFEQAIWQGKLVSTDSIKSVLPGDKLSGKKHRAYFDFGSFHLNDKGKLLSWKHDGSNPSHHAIKYHDFEQNIVITVMSSDGNKSTLYHLVDKVLETFN